MKYLSVCSGIEAASVAWHPLGWQPLAFSEIEPFPRAVLAHHYPNVPLHGDFTKLRDMPFIADADVLVGGTPCQAFSVAGLRNSLADERGNLSLEFVRLADAIDDLRLSAGRDPGIVVWENVPGVLSVKDNAFGCFLAGLAGDVAPYVPPRGKWTNAGVVAGPQRAVAWRVLDAQYFGLAQRRRRVFVVASARDGFDPAAVLLEFEGMRQDTPPRREKGQTTPTLTKECTGVSRVGHNEDGWYVASNSSHWDDPNAPHPTLNQSAKGSGGVGASNQELFSQRGAYLVQEPVIMSSGQANAEIRTDGGAPVLTCLHEAPIATHAVDVCPTLRAGGNSTGGDRPPGTDVDTADSLIVTHSVRAEGFDASEDGTGRGKPLVPVVTQSGAIASTLRTGGNDHADIYNSIAVPLPGVDCHMAVRRLTPVECERLQGFPDNYTLIPWKKKPASECPDGPRYKALGNSMAVPCMAWIGQRIAEQVK